MQDKFKVIFVKIKNYEQSVKEKNKMKQFEFNKSIVNETKEQCKNPFIIFDAIEEDPFGFLLAGVIAHSIYKQLRKDGDTNEESNI